MAKRFKLRLSRVIPSFQSCRSKDSSALPTNPVPSFFRLSPVNPIPKPKPITIHFSPAPPPPPSKPHQSSLKRHMSSALTSFGCVFGSRSSTQYLSETDLSESTPPEFHWEEEEKWHVVAKVLAETPRRKIYNSSASGDTSDDEALPPPPPPNTEKKKRRARKNITTPKIRNSTSSTDSGLFSSEGYDDNIDDEETEALVSSSRSFSTDSSSEFNPHLQTIREAPFSRGTRKKKAKRVKRRLLKNNGKSLNPKNNGGFYSPEIESPARLSMFLQRLIPCTVDGKVRESFAVVKKSEDPYEDFKRSMMEMILEKEMFEEKDLEQLLHCFLSLNSRQHHGVIVEAFYEICAALFCRRLSNHHRVSKAY